MSISRSTIDSLAERIDHDDLLRSIDEIAHALDLLRSGDSAAATRALSWAALLGGVAVNAVLLPLDTGGSDVVLGTLLAGGTVVLGAPDTHPVRMLAALERDGVSHVTLASDLLARLNAEPAAVMTDLGALRRVLYVGPPVRFDQPGPELMRVRITASGGAREASWEGTDADDLVASVSAVRVEGLSIEHVAEFVDRFRDAVLTSMLHALQGGGVLTDPATSHTTPEILAAARVALRHHGVVGRWLTALTEHGVLTCDNNSFYGARPVSTADVDRVWEAADNLWTGRMGSSEVSAYFRLNADRLPGLLAGEVQATLLLFPEGRTDTADALYRHTAVAQYLNAAASAAIGSLARGQRFLRVLEVGAGTGATSEVVLGELTKSGADVDYLFTDVSPFFLSSAKERFAEHTGVRFGLYDIDGDNRTQGYQPQSFDVVLAAGVLNNARDTNATLRRLGDLLAPGGWLVVIEPTREYYEILISQAFVMTAAEDARLRSGTTFLSRQQWFDALAATGFTVEHVTPDDTHPLFPMSQFLFLSRH